MKYNTNGYYDYVLFGGKSIGVYVVIITAIILTVLLIRRFLNLSLLKREGKLLQEFAIKTASFNQTIDNYKKINNKLEAVQQQLLENDKTKEQIINVILHDIWSPLNFMANTSGLILENKDKYSHTELLNFVVSLSGSASNIVHLTDQLLKWLRTQQGALEVNIHEVNVAFILEEILKLYKEIALQRGNTIIINCPPEAMIFTDSIIFTLIVRNLLDNANKNTKNGIIALSFATNAESKSILSITDNGRGLEKEKIKTLIELAGQESLRSGSLGFKFAFEFAKLINAKIGIESVVGEGTEVSITLSSLPF